MRFLLDTDTVSYALRGVGRVGERLRRLGPSQTRVSAITVAELRFGVRKRGSRKLTKLVDEFLGGMVIMSFDETAADAYGQLAADLAARGETIGTIDTMIAAHALALRMTLVTHNRRHFERVPGLEIVDWF